MKNEFAFPFAFYEGKLGEKIDFGMTKLEYFAAAALTGVIAGYPNIARSEAAQKAISYASDLLDKLKK